MVFKLLELSVATNYNQAKMSGAPVGDVLLAVPGTDSLETIIIDGKECYTLKALQTIVKGLSVALYFEADSGDF